MFQTTNIQDGSLLYLLSKVFTVLLVSQSVLGKHVRFTGFDRYPDELEKIDSFGNVVIEHPPRLFELTDIVAINDDEYPEEELNRVVEETKNIILSRDRAARSQIKIDSSYDLAYLFGANCNLGGNNFLCHYQYQLPDIQNHVASSGSFAYSSPGTYSRAGPREELNWDHKEDELSCDYHISPKRPKFLENPRGPNYYVLNTENLDQTMSVVTCMGRNKTCGSSIGGIGGYETMCVQEWQVVYLLTQPDNKEIKVENQEMVPIRIPTDCKCAYERIS